MIAALHDIELARRHFVQALLVRTHLIACGPVAEALTERNLGLAYGPAYHGGPAAAAAAPPRSAPGAGSGR